MKWMVIFGIWEKLDPLTLVLLQNLFDRAKQNGCRDIEMIDGAKIREIEPHCKVSRVGNSHFY